jgi:hypothetical protein
MFGNKLNISKYYSEEIKSRLESGNALYPSVLALLSFSLLSKNLNIKIYTEL